MQLSRSARIALRIAAGIGFAVIYVPLALVLVNSFNPDRSASWPPPGWTLHWWSVAWENDGARNAVWVSVKAGLGATAIALALGTLIAFAVARHRFFGRDAISFVVVLPIALPGIVTGIALNSAFGTVLEPLGVGLGLFTVIVGHATFCIVVVFNNVVARLRRTSGSYEEAAMDLGADTFRAFLDVTFPLVRSALFAGGLLAFALSFDEIVVTTFTAGPGVETLPIWIFNNMTRPQQAPVVNVVAAVLVLLSVVPIYAAQRLSADTATESRI
ncbi:ABC transporter permease [Streptomyces sp. NPDC007264]|uniref:ABC transporter permease n=1 Tax=Streptomyces sp. NPDC007264 TaxID=3364777 RepID=UPI0036D7617F